MPTYEKNRICSVELPDWIDDLFLEFTLVYKHRWVVETDEIEMAAKFIWAKKLAGIDEQVIREAINDSTTLHPSWPPTPGEFLEIAMAKVRALKEKKSYEERLKCISKKPDPEVAKRAMAKIKEECAKKGLFWGKK